MKIDRSLCRLANTRINKDKCQILKLQTEITDYKALLTFCDDFVKAVCKRELKLQHCLVELENSYEEKCLHVENRCFPFFSPGEKPILF